jgi:hypothetical protein
MGCIAFALLPVGVYARGQVSGSINQRVLCKPRPCIGNGLLCDARRVCHHGASRGTKMRSPNPRSLLGEVSEKCH